jgi:hypothetical protein
MERCFVFCMSEDMPADDTRSSRPGKEDTRLTNQVSQKSERSTPVKDIKLNIFCSLLYYHKSDKTSRLVIHGGKVYSDQREVIL